MHILGVNALRTMLGRGSPLDAPPSGLQEIVVVGMKRRLLDLSVEYDAEKKGN